MNKKQWVIKAHKKSSVQFLKQGASKPGKGFNLISCKELAELFSTKEAADQFLNKFKGQLYTLYPDYTFTVKNSKCKK